MEWNVSGSTNGIRTSPRFCSKQTRRNVCGTRWTIGTKQPNDSIAFTRNLSSITSGHIARRACENLRVDDDTILHRRGQQAQGVRLRLAPSHDV